MFHIIIALRFGIKKNFYYKYAEDLKLYLYLLSNFKVHQFETLF